MGTTPGGIDYPDGGSPFDGPGQMKALATDADVGRIIPVANSTDRAQLVAASRAAGGAVDAAHPLYVHRTDLPGLEWTPDGQTWERVGGLTGYAAVSAPQSVGTAETVLSGMSVAVHAIAGRAYEVSVAATLYTQIAGARVFLIIRRGTTTSAPAVARAMFVGPGASIGANLFARGIDTPGAGETTYIATLYVASGGGTVTSDASATYPNTMTVRPA